MFYLYSREVINDSWNINNPLRVDIEGNQIYLAREVSNIFPDKMFKLFCDEARVEFDFVEELTQEEKEILDTCVSNHKNNVNN
jgi:hypothetical protein